MNESTNSSIQKYQVLGELGRGGWGVVYKGRHEDTGQVVAVKLMTRSDDKFRFRFRREIRAASRLNHPNIVRILDSGTHAGREYYIMEYVDGEELGNFWVNNNLFNKLPESLKYVKQICQALAFIHNNGIIHRDIKPSNIMVNREGIIKIMDFGLAKDFTQDTILTQTGEALGTVFYMSPEQILGQKIDKGTDLYSFGVLLYELYVGVRPFSGDETVQVAVKHIREQPPAPRTIRPELPVAIEKILMRLLEKDPSARYGSSEEIWKAFAEIDFTLTESLPPDPDLSLATMPEGIRADALYRPRFVGRDQEFAQMRSAVENALQGSGSAVLVSGEAGVGKSRLVEETCSYARSRDMAAFAAECMEFGQAPCQVFNDLFDIMVRNLTDEDHNNIQPALDNFGPFLSRFFPAIAKLMEKASTPVESSVGIYQPEQEKSRLFHAVTELLRVFSMTHPAILFIDDLQWADDFDIELVSYMTKNLFRAATEPGSKLIVIGAYRGEDVDSKHPVSKFGREIRREKYAIRLSLNRLKEEDVAVFVQSMLGLHHPPVVLVEKIYQESQGNPFFIEEIVYSLLDEQMIAQSDQGWRVMIENMDLSMASADFNRILIPHTIKEVVEKRLERLEEKDLMVLQQASVISASFDYDLLQDITRIEEGELLDIIDNLIKARIIYEQKRGMGYIYDFSHSKIREVVYESIPIQYKKRFHNRAGRVIENLYKSDPDVFLDVLGYQYFSGESYGKALDFLQRAGLKASEHFNFRKAFQFYEQARECVEYLLAEPVQEVESEKELLTTKGYILYNQGGLLLKTADLDEAYAIFEEALEIYRDLNNEEYIAKYHLQVGSIHGSRFQYEKAFEHFEKALDYFEKAGDKDNIVLVIGNLGLNHMYARNLDKALGYFYRALAIHRELNDRQGEFRCLNNIGLLMNYKGDNEKAISHLKQALALVSQFHDRYLEAITLCNVGFICRHLDRNDEALDYIERSLRISRKLGEKEITVANLTNIGTIHFNREDYREALKYHIEALPLRFRIGNLPYLIDEYRKIGRDYTRMEDVEKAVDYLNRGLAEARENDLPEEAAETLIELAESSVHFKHADQAKSYLDAAGIEAEKVKDEKRKESLTSRIESKKRNCDRRFFR